MGEDPPAKPTRGGFFLALGALAPAPMSDVPELPGTNFVRFLDIVVIGPLMLWAAMAPSRLPKPARVALGVFGASTIGFNAVNLVRRRRVAR